MKIPIVCILFPCLVNWNMYILFPSCVFHSHAGFIGIPIVYISFSLGCTGAKRLVYVVQLGP